MKLHGKRKDGDHEVKEYEKIHSMTVLEKALQFDFYIPEASTRSVHGEVSVFVPHFILINTSHLLFYMMSSESVS